MHIKVFNFGEMHSQEERLIAIFMIKKYIFKVVDKEKTLTCYFKDFYFKAIDQRCAD